MKRNDPKNKISAQRIQRRTMVLGGSQALLVGALGLRMRSMQVEHAEEYRLLAEENRISVRLIPPARGQIFDRNGIEIAANVPSYRIVVVREDAGDLDAVIEKLGKLITLNPHEVKEAREDYHKLRHDTPVTIADRVSWRDVSLVAANAPALPGVFPEVGLSRHYPLYDAFSHVVGYVGPPNDKDIEEIDAPKQLLTIPRFQVGKYGVEVKQEDALRGKAGVKRVEVNAANRVMRELERREGDPGADIQLTVDADLQAYIMARLKGESAAAVVIDCENGDILACNSVPGYDPNLFVHGISSKNYKALLENDHRPLPNKAVQGVYPPGSTFKIVTALAALEAGVITAGSTFHCPGYKQLGGRRFRCWKRHGHGSVDLNKSLRESCDVYYYEVALKTGIDKISEMAKRLGVGIRFDLPMTSVSEGLAPTKEWKEISKEQPWVLGDTVNASIGQGFVLASPLQLAMMTARVATGRALMPRLIKSIDGVEQPQHPGEDMGITPKHLDQVRKAMYAVVNSPRGTAKRSRIADEAYLMAGKTGTSQVRSTVVKNSQVPWEQRDHALFVDFAPYDKPKVAVAVIVEHGGGGSAAAAPVARDITLQALFKGDPPLEAYPPGDRGRIKEQQERLKRPEIGTTEDTDSDRA